MGCVAFRKAVRAAGAVWGPGTVYACLLTLLFAGEVYASGLAVTVLSDSGPGSLREAVAAANLTAEADTITFESVSGAIALSTGPITVTSDLVLAGPGAERLAIDAQQLSRHFVVTAGSLTVRDLSLVNGATAVLESGGSVIMANAVVAFERCRVEGNRAARFGGAVQVLSGSLTATACSFLGNAAGRDSGAVNFDGGSGLFVNCTFSDNEADGSGGAIGLFGAVGTVALKHCTLANNRADADGNGAGSGGGAARFAGTLSLESTIAADNAGIGAAPSNLAGSVSATYSLIADATGATVSGIANVLGADPRLGALGDWGGPTPVIPLLPGSPAIDAGFTTHSENFDQRGAPFNREVLAGAPDIGAFEFVPDATIPLAWVTAVGTHTNASPFDAVLNFSEAVYGLDAAEVLVTGGSIEAVNWSEGSAVFAIRVTPAAEGDVVLTIPDGAAFDKGLNPNAASVPLTVIFDQTPPVVTLLGASAVTLEFGEPYVEAGASAVDDVDGDLTGAIQIGGVVDLTDLGATTLLYSVVDRAGNAAQPVVRTVQIIDTTPPTLTLLGEPFAYVLQNTPYADSGAAAFDAFDGDLSAAVAVMGAVDTATLGSYDLIYSVADSSGNAAAPVQRTVVVVGAPQTIYVDAANVSGVEDGTSAHPFRTLAAAVAASQDGRSDTIRVRPGIYNESIALTYRCRVIAEQGPFHTRIISAGADAVTLADESIVRGFGITGATGAALRIPPGSAAEISNCVTWDNGIGVLAETGALASLLHNTFLLSDIAGVSAETGAAVNPLRNTIFAFNAVGVSGGAAALQAGGYNVYGGNTVALAGPAFLPNDFAADPLLVDGASGNGYLLAASPCRDAGDPALAWRDPDGTRADIGATGGPYAVLDTTAPAAAIGASVFEGRPPLAVVFDASASADDAGIAAYAWDFDASNGLAVDSALASPNHLFTVPGNFIVTLRVSDNNGNVGETTAVVAVDGANSPPLIQSVVATPRAGVPPFMAALIAAASDPNGDALSFAWDTNGDGVADAATAAAAVSFPFGAAPGSYPQTLTVTDYLGATTSATLQITVAAQSVLATAATAPNTPTMAVIQGSGGLMEGASIAAPAGASALGHVLSLGLAAVPPALPARPVSAVLEAGPWSVAFSKALDLRIPLLTRPARPGSLVVYRFSSSTQTWTEQGVSNVVYEDDGANGWAVFQATQLGFFIAAQGSAPADVDQNGAVNAIDVQLVINAVLGVPGDFDCDTDGDGRVNARDTQIVINASLGLGAGIE